MTTRTYSIGGGPSRGISNSSIDGGLRIGNVNNVRSGGLATHESVEDFLKSQYPIFDPFEGLIIVDPQDGVLTFNEETQQLVGSEITGAPGLAPYAYFDLGVNGITGDIEIRHRLNFENTEVTQYPTFASLYVANYLGSANQIAGSGQDYWNLRFGGTNVNKQRPVSYHQKGGGGLDIAGTVQELTELTDYWIKWEKFGSPGYTIQATFYSDEYVTPVFSWNAAVDPADAVAGWRYLYLFNMFDNGALRKLNVTLDQWEFVKGIPSPPASA